MELNSLMVRYIVNDVDEAVAFYTEHFGFRVEAQSGPYFALLERDNLQMVLSPPKGPGGGSQPTPDGRRPEPGGWNRIVVRTRILEHDVEILRKAGVRFRSDYLTGPVRAGGVEVGRFKDHRIRHMLSQSPESLSLVFFVRNSGESAERGQLRHAASQT